jgi:uncharacterized protein (DUF2147 family)
MREPGGWTSVLLVGAVGALLTSSGVGAGTMMEGVWAREDGLLGTRVARCGSKFCATTIWAKDPQSDDKVGDRIVATLSADGPRHWTGPAFDVRRKIVFELDVSGSGGKLTTRACASGLCRSEEWTRN